MSSITIELPPEVVERIQVEATRQGLEPNRLIVAVLHDRFPQDNLPNVDDRNVDRLAKLQQLFGCWRDQTDLGQIFAQIDQDRHTDLGRELDLP
jgi:hypothetical protein